MVRINNEGAAYRAALLESLPNFGLVFCIVFALVGIKIWWFRHRLTINDGSKSNNSEDNSQVQITNQNLVSRNKRVPSQQFREPVQIQGVFRKRPEDELERPISLPAVRPRQLSTNAPGHFRPSNNLSHRLNTRSEYLDVPQPPTHDPPTPPVNDLSVVTSNNLQSVLSKDQTSLHRTDLLAPSKYDLPMRLTCDLPKPPMYDPPLPPKHLLPSVSLNNLPSVPSSVKSSSLNLQTASTHDLQKPPAHDPSVPHLNDLPEEDDLSPETPTRGVSTTFLTHDVPAPPSQDAPVPPKNDLSAYLPYDPPIKPIYALPTPRTYNSSMSLPNDFSTTDTQESHLQDLPVKSTKDLPAALASDIPAPSTQNPPIPSIRNHQRLLTSEAQGATATTIIKPQTTELPSVSYAQINQKEWQTCTEFEFQEEFYSDDSEPTYRNYSDLKPRRPLKRNKSNQLEDNERMFKERIKAQASVNRFQPISSFVERRVTSYGSIPKDIERELFEEDTEDLNTYDYTKENLYSDYKKEEKSKLRKWKDLQNYKDEIMDKKMDNLKSEKENDNLKNKFLNQRTGTETKSSSHESYNEQLWLEMERQIDKDSVNIEEEFNRIRNSYEINEKKFLEVSNIKNIDTGFGKNIDEDWENFEKLANETDEREGEQRSTKYERAREMEKHQARQVHFKLNYCNDDIDDNVIERDYNKYKAIKFKSIITRERRPTGFAKDASEITSQLMTLENKEENADEDGIEFKKYEDLEYTDHEFTENQQDDLNDDSVKLKPRQKVTFQEWKDEIHREVPKPMQRMTKLVCYNMSDPEKNGSNATQLVTTYAAAEYETVTREPDRHN